MNKIPALIISFLVTFLFVSDYYLISIVKAELNKEEVIVKRVIDGDTIVLHDGRTVRLMNINSPEKNVPGSDLSTFYLKQYENKSIYIHSEELDKYNRTLGRVYSKDNEYLNLKIVEEGFSSKFLVSEKEKKKFSEAEENAIKNSLGIWKKSSYYGCLNGEIDKFEEVIFLKNDCPNLNFYNFTLKDESRKVFVFPSIYFSKIIVHSFSGKDNLTDLFWRSKSNIWNDDSDTIYIFDSSNKIVLAKSYGY